MPLGHNLLTLVKGKDKLVKDRKTKGGRYPAGEKTGKTGEGMKEENKIVKSISEPGDDQLYRKNQTTLKKTFLNLFPQTL